MHLGYSDEHRQFADGLDRFLAKGHAFERRRALLRDGVASDPALWAQLAELGCLALSLPEALGGLDAEPVLLGLMARALGRHLVVEPVLPAVLAGLWLGAAEGAQGHAERLARGEGRYAVAAGLVVTSAGISGRALGVPGASSADFLLVPDETGLHVVAAARVARTPVAMLDDSIAADIVAEDAPSERLAPGAGWAMAGVRAAQAEALFRAWQALGCLEAAADATAAYMRDRVQFGRPLAAFQVVQHRVAEMVVAARDAEVAALLGALGLAGASPDVARALAVMTARVAAAAGLVADSAVQLHGGMGVSDELDIAARFRLLQAFRLAVGDDPVRRYAEDVVAKGGHLRSAVLAEI